MSGVGAARPGPTVGSTDLLKLAGLVLVVVDHVGLFFAPDQEAWRVAGRCAAPIFFFLIGYTGARPVPWTWLVLGALLTATDHVTSSDTSLNILLNFALLRTALPHIQAWIGGRAAPGADGPSPGDAGAAWRTALLAGGLVLLIPVLDPHLEYGAEGWLWALLGLWQRRAVEAPGWEAARTRDGVAAVTALAYTWREIADHEFEGAEAAALLVLVAGLALLLTRFRRVPLRRRPPPVLARPLAFAGRHSLELYAASLFLMQVAAYALGFEAGE